MHTTRRTVRFICLPQRLIAHCMVLLFEIDIRWRATAWKRQECIVVTPGVTIASSARASLFAVTSRLKIACNQSTSEQIRSVEEVRCSTSDTLDQWSLVNRLLTSHPTLKFMKCGVYVKCLHGNAWKLMMLEEHQATAPFLKCTYFNSRRCSYLKKVIFKRISQCKRYIARLLLLAYTVSKKDVGRHVT